MGRCLFWEEQGVLESQLNRVSYGTQGIAIDVIIMKTCDLFIQGKCQPSSSNSTFYSYNPMTSAPYALVTQAEASDVEQAISVAHQAFQQWKQSPPALRERILLAVADLLSQRQDEFRDCLIEESGSTFLKASFEASHTPDFLRTMAGECRRVTGETFHSNLPGVQSYSVRRPLGVIAAVTPFNFPLLLVVKKIGWALAAGNTVVLKPSERTPVVALKLAHLFQEAGLPDGVLNVITGEGKELVEAMVDHPRVRYITFTGSSEVGRQIAVRAARQGKKYSLEMGGKNPLVILKDADLSYACQVAAFSNYFHQGQICMTGSRIIVESDIYDAFLEKFTNTVAQLKVGNPHDPETVVGPLISLKQSDLIRQSINEAVESGAVLVTGGTSDGALFQPTIVADVKPEMAIFHKELFGSCACVIKADSAEHALALANQTEYGLSSAVLTNDLQKAMMFSEGLDTGMVHINGPTVRDEGIIPFGGVKNSGLGREGGRFAMEELTALKWVTIQQGQQVFPSRFSL